MKSVKHIFGTFHTIISDYGDARKLTGYLLFTKYKQKNKKVKKILKKWTLFLIRRLFISIGDSMPGWLYPEGVHEKNYPLLKYKYRMQSSKSGQFKKGERIYEEEL